MAKNLSDVWQRRIENQKFDLVGSHQKGDGNGYHDRVSFEVPYHLRSQVNMNRVHSWLYSVYFRNMEDSLNARLNSNHGKDFMNALRIENCSQEYLKTLYRYFGGKDGYHRNSVLEELGVWGKDLIRDGRVIVEFVSWFDNETEDFYGFELIPLEILNCRVKKNMILFTAPHENEQGEFTEKTVEIPASKCIIIDWPDSLGGFDAHRATVNEIFKIDNKLKPSSSLWNANPLSYMSEMDRSDLMFNSLIRKWGTADSYKLTTEFYKFYNYFNYRKTVAMCANSLMAGFETVIGKLNERLDEKATVDFQLSVFDVEEIESKKKDFMEGRMTMEEADKFLAAR